MSLLVGAAAVGLGVRLLVAWGSPATARRQPRLTTALARVEFLTLAIAVVAGATLTGLPDGPGRALAPGAPLVRRLLIDDALTGLVVVPQRPGRNLVHLVTDSLFAS